MKNSKLASLLSKLSQKEFKEFGKFVKSPYFNSSSNLIKLYDIIAKHFPNLEHEKLSKENLYKHVYPGEKYNDSTARGLLSSMLKLGEEFLAVMYLREREHFMKEFLMGELAQRKIEDLFNIHYKNAINELDSLNVRDEEYFFFRHRLETLQNSVQSKSYIPLTQKDIPGDMNPKDTENLILFFLITLLKRYNYLLTKMGSLNINPDFTFFEEAMDYLSKIDLTGIPVLNFHYARAMLYKSNMDEKYFLILQKIFYDNFENLDITERYNIFATLQNFCVRKTRVGEQNTAAVQYELYKFAMEKEILTFDEVEPIHHILFSNIVSAMIYLDKTDEAKDFIEKYKARLAPERLESSVNLNLAKIFFKERKFEESLSLLARVHNEDVFYKVAIKNLNAMIYYEKGFTEELILLLDSYRSFLNSNIVIAARLKENHLGFVNILSRLIKFRDIKNKSEIEYLKHETENHDTVVNREWLIEKLNEAL